MKRKLVCGLKQEPKQRYDKFDYIILSYCLRHNNADKCIYSKFTIDYGVIICLYVDDLLIVRINIKGVYMILRNI